RRSAYGAGRNIVTGKSWPTAIPRGKLNPGSNPWPQRAFLWGKPDSNAKPGRAAAAQPRTRFTPERGQASGAAFTPHVALLKPSGSERHPKCMETTRKMTKSPRGGAHRRAFPAPG